MIAMPREHPCTCPETMIDLHCPSHGPDRERTNSGVVIGYVFVGCINLVISYISAWAGEPLRGLYFLAVGWFCIWMVKP